MLLLLFGGGSAYRIEVSWAEVAVPAVGFTTYTYTGTGGLTLAGAADVAKVKVYTGSGGLTLAGAATVAKVKSYTPTGGIVLAGAATTEYLPPGATTYRYTGTGGLTLAGAATTSRLSVYSYTATGGLTLAGAANTAKVKAYTASGGLTLAGAATTLFATTNAYTATGGLTLAGAATTAFVSIHTYTATGGLTFAGVADLKKVKAYIASGGLTLAGAATTSYVPGLVVYSYTATGGITLNGSATTSGPTIAGGQRPAGGIGGGRKKYRKPRPMRRIQIGDKDYIIPEKDFPAFMQAVLRKQPPPPSVEVEPAITPKKPAPKPKPARVEEPVAQAVRFVLDEIAEAPELEEAVQEHRPDLMPQFWAEAMQAYISQAVDRRVADAVMGLRQYVDATVATNMAEVKNDLHDEMQALEMLID